MPVNLWKSICAVVLAGPIYGLAALPAVSQVRPAPPAGFSLTLTLGPGWSSNPFDLPGQRKGDGYFGFETTLRHRWALWQGAAFTVSGTGYSELYAREAGAGINRIATGAVFSQNWMGSLLTLGVSARTSANQMLTAHDTASQDASIGLSRPFALTKDLILTLSGGGGRRFYQDGSEDQFRARFGATLARKWNRWTFEGGGNLAWALEDKTPFLPRINDRTVSAYLGLSYEWAKDRDIGAKFTWTRTYSSLPINRTKTFGFTPQMAATLRF